MINFLKYFLIVFYSTACCSEVAVFQANNETLLFYPDGKLESFSAGVSYRQSSNVKYCNPDSGWRCIISQYLIIAIPNNDEDKKNWCFGGLRHKKVNTSDSGTIHYFGENKRDNDLSISLYDFKRGVMFVNFSKGKKEGYTLISREGLLSNLFIESIPSKSYLTSEEFSILAKMCPKYDAYLKSEFKRKILNSLLIVN